MLPDPPNDMNMYAGLIALGVCLLSCLFVRYSNGGQGTRPTGDMLSWIVHTRLGLGSKSWLGKQLDLGVLLGATVGEILVVSVYIGWLVIRFVYYYELYEPTTKFLAVRVGKAFGQLAPPMILMEYLSAQRYTIWVWVAGIPHERLIGYHRVSSAISSSSKTSTDRATHCGILFVQVHGWAFYWILCAHMVCMSVAIRERVNGFPIVRQLDDPMELTKINPALGVASFLCFTVTVLSSLEYIRRNYWGKFYLTHFSFFPAVVLALFHSRIFTLPWTVAAAGFFYIDVGTRFYMKFMRKSKVEAAEVLPEGVVKLTLSTGATMPYEAGQYIWLALAAVPGAGPLAGFAFHPYSISSAYTKGDATYTLHMKSMGPGTWSEAVLQAAKAGGAAAFAAGCRVGGPSGRFSINPAHFDRLVLVAGGIGAPPLFSLLLDVARDAAAAAQAGGPPRRYPAAKQVTVLWAVPHEQCLSWFAEDLDAARAAGAAAGLTVDVQCFVTRGKATAGEPAAGDRGNLVFTAAGERESLPVSIAMSGSAFGDGSAMPTMAGVRDVEAAAAQPRFVRGRPDLGAVLASVAAAGGPGPSGVFACGPEAMLEGTRQAVVAANRAAGGDAARRFLLHVEVFHF